MKKPDPRYGAIAIRDNRVFKITQWLTSSLASAVPVISIAVLDRIKTREARIGTIAAFNVLLAVCLIIFTEAKRTDIFAVTAS
jgi:hypothetical protein